MGYPGLLPYSLPRAGNRVAEEILGPLAEQRLQTGPSHLLPSAGDRGMEAGTLSQTLCLASLPTQTLRGSLVTQKLPGLVLSIPPAGEVTGEG